MIKKTQNEEKYVCYCLHCQIISSHVIFRFLGGWDELIKGAGKDATMLFNDVHQWVNYQSMLSACVVGKLITEFLPPKPVRKSLPQKSGWYTRDQSHYTYVSRGEQFLLIRN